MARYLRRTTIRNEKIKNKFVNQTCCIDAEQENSIKF